MTDVPFHPRAVEAALLLFDQVELLDFAGPCEVLAAAGRPDGPLRFRVRSIGVGAEVVRARGGPRLIADAREDALEHESFRVVIVPGGFGVRALLEETPVIELLRRLHERGTTIASVCTGAWLLARAGLLDGREATTHQIGFERLVELAPTCVPRRGARVVDTGDIVTAAGVAAGIDLGIALVERWWGAAVARTTAQHIEWR